MSDFKSDLSIDWWKERTKTIWGTFVYNSTLEIAGDSRVKGLTDVSRLVGTTDCDLYIHFYLKQPNSVTLK